MKLNRRLFETVRRLKARQVLARARRTVRGRLGLHRLRPAAAPAAAPLRPGTGLPAPASVRGNVFTFLNLSRDFAAGIDWEFAGHGRLWTYNLAYFDFLRQPGMGREEGLALIRDFLRDLPARTTALEPYPLSLRGMNWIRFLCRWDVRDRDIADALYAQYRHLLRNIEYPLMGNHLLENGFSLLLAGRYFGEPAFERAAARLLRRQLDEQILPDGAHFELSPMYHSILLERVLDAADLLARTPGRDGALAAQVRDRAAAMAGWLKAVAFSDGTLPAVNDTAQGIAARPTDLLAYAERLGIAPTDAPPGASGYRTIRRRGYEAFADVGNIGPDYQPGHAHSDTLSLLLHAAGRPFLVDTGVSTYDASPRRLLERGTAAHNTVTVDGAEQSDVWDAFRVGRRARIVARTEEPDRLEAAHDGYRPLGCLHRREFRFGAAEITVTDRIEPLPGRTGSHEAVARFHFHPDVAVAALDHEAVRTDLGNFRFEAHAALAIEDYEFCEGYNRRRAAKALAITFRDTLRTQIGLR